MHQKQVAWFIIGVFVVVAVIFALSIMAIPHAGQMVYASKAEDRSVELITLQAAAAEMLRQSPSGEILSIGPTDDMNLVLTVDAEPLVLADFLDACKGGRLTSGYAYSFTADGTVIQFEE
jgi:hypothetical protein